MMSDHREQDEKLSQLADEIIEHGLVHRSKVDSGEDLSDEIQELQQVMTRLYTAFNEPEVDEEMSKRIEGRLLQEFRQLYPGPVKKPVWVRLREFLMLDVPVARQFAPIAAALMIVLAGVLAINPGDGTGGNLSGAAGGGSLQITVLNVVLAVCGAVILAWSLHRGRT